MFLKKRAPTARRAASSPAMANSTFSVLGTDIAIKGDISASVDLHIDGRVEGDITCASLIQGETSEISGNVHAEIARLSGIVRGSISARELIVLKSARIHGDVHYDTLTIEQGATVEGRFAPRGPAENAGEEPLLTLAG